MRILGMAVMALLLVSGPAGAEEKQLVVSATVLSHCQFRVASVHARDGIATASIVRCSGTGATVPYRLSGAGTATTSALPHNTEATIATTRHGKVLTINL